MPDFLAIPVLPLVYLIPKELSKLLIGLVKIYCALLMDNSGGTHDNVKMIEDGEQGEKILRLRAIVRDIR